MLNENIMQWIEESVEGIYSENRLVTSLKAFDMFLDINKTPVRFEKYLEFMYNASQEEQRLFLSKFSSVELFMKALYNTLFEDVYDVEEIDDDKSIDIDRYADLLKSTFHKLPEEMPLTSTDYTTLTQGYQRQYLEVYQYRNSLTHDSKQKLLKHKINSIIDSTLVNYLDLSYDYRQKITQMYDQMIMSGYLDRQSYAAAINADYNRYFAAFRYLDTHWNSADAASQEMKLEDIISSNRFVFKMLGEAGTGKTTALRRIEHLLAEKVRKFPSAPLPVYLPLGTLSKQDDLIINAISRKLSITVNQVNDLITHRQVYLLLDGFNEMLNYETQVVFASELDALSHKYKSLRIILTDRTTVRPLVPVLTKATELYLKPLSLEDKLKYFQLNCRDEEIMQMIREAAEDDPGLLDEVTTPLELKHYLEVAVSQHKLPVDLAFSYINALFAREQNEKKDQNMIYLPSFLQSISTIKLPAQKTTVLQRFALVKQLLGYSFPDSEVCLNLAIAMGILQLENGDMISFINENTRFFFECEGDRSGLLELLKNHE